jgi:hypothetical protein
LEKMVAGRELRILLQTGHRTPPDSLIRDLEAIQDVSIDIRRLGTSFRGGGVAAFVMISTHNSNTAMLTDILHSHTKRLKDKGGDDLVVLIGGKINTNEEMVGFRDVQCQKHISLKGKSKEEIREILEE